MNWTSHLGDTWCIVLLTIGSFTAGNIFMFSWITSKIFPRKLTKEEVDRLKGIE